MSRRVTVPGRPRDTFWVARSGGSRRPLEGTVTEIGITYLRLDTGNGLVLLPNSQVLAAAVSHQPPAPQPGVPRHDGHGQ
jgi:small-conductance mechanosensitive channel